MRRNGRMTKKGYHKGYLPRSTPYLHYCPPLDLSDLSTGSRSSLSLYSHFLNDAWEDVIHVAAPLSHISYLVHGKPYFDIMSTGAFQRLGWITNLGVTSIDVITAEHSRIPHSILQAVMAELVLRKHNASERDVHLGIFAGLLHDAAIPPYSDYGKLANHDELDEERNIDLVLAAKEFDGAFEQHGLSRQDIASAVRGKGIVGSLINSKGIDLDKIAYTAVDLQHVYGRNRNDGMGIAHRQPPLFDIYEDITLTEDGKMVFSDPVRVFRFLLVRAYMYDHVHFSPTSRAREAHLEGVLRKLWREGVLNRENMTTMADPEFFALLQEQGFAHPNRATSFPQLQEVARVYAKGNPTGFYSSDRITVKTWRTFNPGTTTLVWHNGTACQFRDAFPAQAARIEDISARHAYTAMYIRNNDAQREIGGRTVWS
ncbi:hypothetical protein HYS47_02415 [Candidatus Woesearchaeota archaeon]|nr:hypothetical protein [Candidatus Woesearchaeota archaeon]